MAEALATLGIAANVAQFIGLSMQLVAEGRKVYDSIHGAREDHRDLELMIDNMESLNQQITKGLQDMEEASEKMVAGRPWMVREEAATLALIRQCEPISKQLRQILEDLKVRKDARFRTLAVARQTLRYVGKKKEIEDLRRRLLELDSQLKARLMFVLQTKNRADIASAITALDRKHDKLSVNTDKKLEDAKDGILKALSHLRRQPSNQWMTGDQVALKLDEFINKAKNMEQQHQILDSLRYASMRQREDNVREAHKRTLRWVFDNPDVELLTWLRKEDGIFWVKGKAGSGKSTLMKYVASHERTLEALQQWASPQRLITAHHYFWHAGLPIQKSQIGLLMSLLHQILVGFPQFISDVCSIHRLGESWGRKELFEILQRIAKSPSLPAKFCFFVDGLDEYDGDDEEILRLMLDLTTSPSIKICVSSRPWNTFLDAFDHSRWKLTMEDLTKNDMTFYVHDLLSENIVFRKFARRDDRYISLEEQITERASGVWLWVFLVVRDLLRDLKGGEEYAFLQKRLESFPIELEEYFQNIMNRIDRIYLVETARIFLVTVEAVRPLPVLGFKYVILERNDLDAIISMETTPVGQLESSEVFHKYRKLLNNRCRDLLAVNIRSSGTPPLQYEVDFLHKTVRDFLRDSYQTQLLQRAGDDFSAAESLCGIIVALVKRFRGTKDQFFRLIDDIMYYSRELELKTKRANTALLDELDRAATIHTKNSKVKGHWTNAKRQLQSDAFAENGHCTFLALAIQARLLLYVKEKLEADPRLVHRKRGRPLLDYALWPQRMVPTVYDDPVIDIDMVRLLLRYGADPNQKVNIHGGQTLWCLFLISCYQNATRVSPPVKTAWFETTELLIAHGADLGMRCDMSPTKGAEDWDDAVDTWVDDDKTVYKDVSQIFREVYAEDQVLRLEIQMLEARQRRTSVFWKIIGWK